jgi:hypothetical protein
MGAGTRGARVGWWATAIQLRVRDGSHTSHQLFGSVRQAVRMAEAHHEAGREVHLIGSSGRVLLHYEPRNGRFRGPFSPGT